MQVPAFIVAGAPTPAGAAYVARLDDWIRRSIGTAGDPGAALVVVDAHGIVHCRGFGVDARNRPVTCRTRFAVASLTKSVTALEIVLLAERGHIALSAPVPTYLPWFRLRDMDAASRITIEQLLTQRSGLSEDTGRAWLAKTDDDDGALERRVRALANVRLASTPATAFAYSNANFDVLGAVIAAVRGTSYERAIREDIFKPLAIADAKFARGDPPVAGFSRVFGWPVVAGREPAMRGDAPAAGMVVDPLSYGRYLAAHVDAGRTWSRAVAPPAVWGRVHQSPRGSPYAMGWYEDVGPRIHQLRSAGAAPDFSSWAIILPERGVGAAIFANANEAVDGGRADWLETGVERILTDRDPPRAPVIALDLTIRLAVLAGLLGLITSMIGGLRNRSRSRAAVGLGVALVVLAVVRLAILPTMGGSLAVGLLYAPDLTMMLIAAVTIAAAYAALATFSLVRRRN